VNATVSMNPCSLPQELERTFQDHYRLIYRTAYRVTGTAEDAEDVLQTVFLKLMRSNSLEGFRENPKAYLYRSAVNLSLDVIRTRRRRVLPVDLMPQLAPVRDTPIQENLRAAMTKLNPKAAEILILRHVHGYTDAEIARFLGRSRASVAVSCSGPGHASGS
jgi:RNA polymerase sigma-70 factor, ECF subfamily